MMSNTDHATIDTRCYAVAKLVEEGNLPKAVEEFFNTVPEKDRRYVYHGILLLLVTMDIDQATISEFMVITQTAAYECQIKMFHIQSRWLMDNILLKSRGGTHSCV